MKNIPEAPLPCPSCSGVLLDGNNLWVCENDDCMSMSFEPKVVRELEQYRRFGVHLSHCNFGEEAGYCKYGDDDCPALTEGWKWMGDAITKSENKDKTIARLRQRIIDLEEELSS